MKEISALRNAIENFRKRRSKENAATCRFRAMELAFVTFDRLMLVGQDKKLQEVKNALSELCMIFAGYPRFAHELSYPKRYLAWIEAFSSGGLKKFLSTIESDFEALKKSQQLSAQTPL